MPVAASTAYTTARSVTALVRALLDDAANLLSIPVGIASISRNTANSTVTVTTVLPHNQVPGDAALISQVPTGTSNFNGTFEVLTVLGRQFTYAQAGVNDAQSSGRTQGYGIGQVYTDAVLMPYVNACYQSLGRKLESLSDPTYIVDGAFLTVPAVAAPDPSVTVVINDATAAPNQLPTNLLKPLRIWERQSGSTDEFVEMTNLTEQGGLPSVEQGQTLGVWEWRQDGIYFIGATVPVQIRLRYEAYMADLVDGTSSLLLRNTREQIAFPAAVLAGKSRGAEIPPEFTQMGEDALEDVLNLTTRQLQRKNFRLRGYSRRRGYGYS